MNEKDRRNRVDSTDNVSNSDSADNVDNADNADNTDSTVNKKNAEDTYDDEYDYEKETYKKGILTGILIGISFIFVIIIALSLISAMTHKSTIKNTVSKITGTDKIGSLESVIEKYYYKDVDTDDLEDGECKGMLESLNDPYSEYYTEEEYDSLLESLTGNFVGIGAGVTADEETGYVKIAEVYEDSPAEKVGIQAEDLIIKVDDKDISSYSLTQVVSMVKGKEGTVVKIGILRGEEELSFDVTRAEIETKIVEYEMLSDNVGYIHLYEFNDNSPSQVKSALKALKAQGMTKLVFDVRDNPGGALEAVQSIMSFFLPKDELLIYYRDKNGDGEDFYSEKDGSYIDIPMTVLVNENSASASEAFSGCMKVYNRAVIVGVKTYGKGVMQSIMELDDGSAVRLTTAKYYLPDGSNIHEVGIEPDEVVEVPDTIENIWKVSHEEDPQLSKALEVVNDMDSVEINDDFETETEKAG